MTTGPDETPPQRSAREQFGRVAARYRTSRTHAVLGRLVDLSGFIAGRHYSTAVDIGTGPGFTAFAVAPYAGRVIATDVAPAMLDQMRALRAEHGEPGVEAMLAAAESLPCADGSVDLVTCRTAAHHFTDLPRWLSEVARVLAPGGVLAVADTVAPDDPEAAAWMQRIERQRDPSHVRNLSAAEWRVSVQAAGLRLTHDEGSKVSLQYPDWAERAGMEPGAMEALRAEMLAAPPAVKRAFGIDPHPDGSVDFYWDVVVLTAEKG